MNYIQHQQRFCLPIHVIEFATEGENDESDNCLRKGTNDFEELGDHISTEGTRY